MTTNLINKYAEFEAAVEKTFGSAPSTQTRNKLRTLSDDGRLTARVVTIIHLVRTCSIQLNPREKFPKGRFPFRPSTNNPLDLIIPNTARQLASKPEEVIQWLFKCMAELFSEIETELEELDDDFTGSQQALLDDIMEYWKFDREGVYGALGLAGQNLRYSVSHMTSPAWIRYQYILEVDPRDLDAAKVVKLREQAREEVRRCTHAIPEDVVRLLGLVPRPKPPGYDEEVKCLEQQQEALSEAYQYLDEQFESILYP
ncbi:hypothetical protein ACWPKO_17455 [Coraliomargarita sp. W4R53]